MPQFNMLNGIQNKLFGSTKQTAIDVQLAEMADARKGILYFLGNTRAESVQAGFSFTNAALVYGGSGITTMPGDLLALPAWLYQQTAGRSTLGQSLSEMAGFAADEISKIDRMISEFFAWAIDRLASLFGRFSTTVSNFLLTLSTDSLMVLVATRLSTTFKAVTPGVAHYTLLSQFYSGLVHTIQGLKAFFMQLWSGRDADFLGGYPSTIANAMARHSLAKAGGGIMDAGVNFGVAVGATVGAALGTLPVILMQVFRDIVSWLEGIIQRYLVNKSFKKANEAWQAIKAHQASRANAEPTLLTDHNEFSAWFRKAVIPCPVIAALAVSCGFAANPLRFLQILDDTLLGKLTNKNDPSLVHTCHAEAAKMQAAYNEGEQHINHLKRLAMTYIPEYCNDYHVKFCSDDPVVSVRLDTMMVGITPQKAEQSPQQVKPRKLQFVGGPFGGYISS